MFSFLFKKNHQKIIKRLLILAFSLLIFISILVAYLYSQVNKNPEVKAQKEVKILVSEVGKLIELPEGETPTIATVLAEDKVNKELFFKNAEVGDKLLAYLKAKKAILYRPATNKIIEVAPIILDENTK